MMRSKIKYYAVWGTNALGVFDSFHRVCEAKVYVRSFRNESFDSIEEAVKVAMDNYNDIQSHFKKPKYCLGISKLNWLSYSKNMIGA